MDGRNVLLQWNPRLVSMVQVHCFLDYQVKVAVGDQEFDSLLDLEWNKSHCISFRIFPDQWLCHDW